MSVLVDTNILLRMAQPSHVFHHVATRSVSLLLQTGERVFFCPQNVTEFWHVATRPLAANGLAFSPREARRELENIEGLLEFLPEDPVIYPQWKQLVVDHQVSGIKVFDARLAAVATVNKVGSILTFNARDFRRFAGLTILEPETVVQP